GCGAIAGYARPGQSWDYYEIDPAVIGIAENTNLFTFLKGCAQAPMRIVPGDARLRLREAADAGYGLLIMDAFTSDSIPLHLLTREALALYLGKLEPHGLLAVNISNRYLDLTPVVAALAADAGLEGYHWEDPYEEKDVGKEPSHWAVLARDGAQLESFRRDPRWKALEPSPGARPWTDDFSNVLRVMKWGGGE
ncbi:MAG TPA: fused MFS/spermidine synthase, partial [Myxococcota bacterium]|nr:fused MFS/spermidine synthase [Myxococcota bacterium]